MKKSKKQYKKPVLVKKEQNRVHAGGCMHTDTYDCGSTVVRQ